jgi:hypothetical protein
LRYNPTQKYNKKETIKKRPTLGFFLLISIMASNENRTSSSSLREECAHLITGLGALMSSSYPADDARRAKALLIRNYLFGNANQLSPSNEVTNISSLSSRIKTVVDELARRINNNHSLLYNFAKGRFDSKFGLSSASGGKRRRTHRRHRRRTGRKTRVRKN